MSGSAVAVEGLVMSYGGVPAVDRLTLDIARGSITAVLGPNGAGKTTTIETCEGFRRPDAGTVRVLGLDPIRDATALRPRVGVMLQSGGAWSGVRAHEMLRHIAALHADPLDVDMLTDRLGLDGCGRTPYRRLSGGQQQRLGIAMAVVGRPELVFLDEPTAGLDPQARHSAWKLVRELRDDGVTVVLTTHYMDEAERLADHVHVLDRGRLVASGSPDQLTTQGAENTIRFHAQSGLDLAGLIVELADRTLVEETAPGSYLLRGSVNTRTLADLTAWADRSGVLIEFLAVERRTLEDVFLDLTGRELRS